MNKTAQFNIPLSVPKACSKKYLQNLNDLTFGTGRMLLMAADQRVEHLNTSFFGKNISIDDLTPEHFFKIASMSKVSCLATQFGFIDKYGKKYPNIPYLIKLNSISKFVKDGVGYINSKNLISVKKAVKISEAKKLNLKGFGFTVFLGIADESKMLHQASKNIIEAHSLGYPVVLWVYPKGKGVKNENDPIVINTAVSVASALGADFVKVKKPKKNKTELKTLIKQAVINAGETKVLISGGSQVSEDKFLKETYNIINYGGASGVAVGRNIHQKSLDKAVNFVNELHNIVIKKEPLANVVNTNKKVSSLI